MHFFVHWSLIFLVWALTNSLNLNKALRIFLRRPKQLQFRYRYSSYIGKRAKESFTSMTKTSHDVCPDHFHAETQRRRQRQRLREENGRRFIRLNSYLPLDEFPPFLLSCSASKTSRATVREVMLKSTFSQEHINIVSCVKAHLPAAANS